MVARRPACARARFLQLPYFRRIGRRTEWFATTRNNSPPAIGTAFLLHFTDRGTVRRTHRVATTSFFSRCRAITLRGHAKYLPTVLQEQSRHRKELCIVRTDWQSVRTVRSMFPTIRADEFI